MSSSPPTRTAHGDTAVSEFVPKVVALQGAWVAGSKGAAGISRGL